MNILIATLGSEPQVITAAHDLLTERGIQIGRLEIVHPSPAYLPIQVGLGRLRETFDQAAGSHKTEVVYHQIADEYGRAFEDIDTPAAVSAVFRVIYRAVWAAKQAGAAVHLAISGGRKPMALFAMAAAQLLFDENDRLWYLVSSGEFLTSKRLHPTRDDDVHLVEVPVILWSHASPVFAQLRRIQDPFEAIRRVQALRLGEKVADARAFILGSLTPAERRVVEILVRDGASDQEIARRLTISHRTVEQHLRSAYAKACDHWELDEVNRGQLIALLQLYYSTEIRENPHDIPIEGG